MQHVACKSDCDLKRLLIFTVVNVLCITQIQRAKLYIIVVCGLSVYTVIDDSNVGGSQRGEGINCSNTKGGWGIVTGSEVTTL